MFDDIQTATKAILGEVCMILARPKYNYVIVGGWCPMLRGRNDLFGHPGTNDVDLLFDMIISDIRDASINLMRNGYVVSAKHPFQLLKNLLVGDREFVFNVDLLHPTNSLDEFGLFTDIMDLGIRERPNDTATRFIQSIAFPSAGIVFARGLWSDLSVQMRLPDGTKSQVGIPLIDEAGLILSKCVSVKSVKRTRDAFDIYYLLRGAHGSDIAKRVRRLQDEAPETARTWKSLHDFLRTNADTFDANVRVHLEKPPDRSPAHFVQSQIF